MILILTLVIIQLIDTSCRRALSVKTEHKIYVTGADGAYSADILMSTERVCCTGDSSCQASDYISSTYGDIYCTASSLSFSDIYYARNVFIYALNPAAFLYVNYITESVYPSNQYTVLVNK